MLQQPAQLHQIRQAEGGASRRHHDEWIGWCQIGPLHRHAAHSPFVVVVIDARFTPIVAMSNQREGSSIQGMERMGDLERFRLTGP